MGFLAKLKEGLAKTKNAIWGRIDAMLKAFVKVDEDLLEELEELLITADVGVTATEEILDRLREEIKEERLKSPDQVKDALKVMKGVRSAGAVFAGAWTPESAGDFVAGPSHVLPTGGAANMFNGLTPDDFRRRHSFVAFTKGDLAQTKSTIEAFARVEGLDAHGRAATIRFEGPQ